MGKLWLSNLSSFKLIMMVALLMLVSLYIEYYANLRAVISFYHAEKKLYMDDLNQLKKLKAEVQDLTSSTSFRLSTSSRDLFAGSSEVPLTLDPANKSRDDVVKIINDVGDGFRVNKVPGKNCYQIIGLGDYADFFDLAKKFDNNNIRIRSFLLKSNGGKKISIYLKVVGV